MAMSVSFAGSRTTQHMFLKKWGSITLLMVCLSVAVSASYAAGGKSVAMEDPAADLTAQAEAQPDAQENVQQVEQGTSKPAVTPFYEKSAASSTAITGTPSVGSGGHLLNVTLGLLLIIGLIFALSFFVKRFGTGAFAGNGQLKILSSMPLGTRERIVLVDAAGQQLLLGITPTSINTLHVFSEPVVVNSPHTASPDFSQTLMSLLQPKKAARTSGDNLRTPDNNNSAV